MMHKVKIDSGKDKGKTQAVGQTVPKMGNFREKLYLKWEILNRYTLCFLMTKLISQLLNFEVNY